MHRTPNTRELDKLFDQRSSYFPYGVLGNWEWERLGALYLDTACSSGRFAAVPQRSPSFREFQRQCAGEMAEQGYLVREVVRGKVEVLSPSYDLALRMYGMDKRGKRVVELPRTLLRPEGVKDTD